ncbi:class I SAM-dependent methyltransferase [Polyangium sorediatum]|uniref:Class I SAM-dependent methyltransferase n=1 Tax=Polyangium sorediatum TaxID=889274 RepID=A0ABT6P149_9BACT|nr:class I SAM-dependent methyltransferase [Polyangium sorediatum]MDI1434337.1 class I SAM-dependent methyltransferase [Polyangium sorediatum]
MARNRWSRWRVTSGHDGRDAHSRVFDDAIRPWMAKHPGGTIVELAAGLETEFQRCDDGKVRWVCVDVPEAIAVRERFLKANERCKHVSKSALDFSWMDEVDGSRGVFVTAQGLLMYFHERDVRRLFRAIVERFPGVELMFDVIPRWFSKKTLAGLRKTKHYTAPPMPWGVNRSEVKRLIGSWSPRITSVEQVSFGYFRGVPGLLLPVFSKVPMLRDVIPSIVRVQTSRWTS